MSSKSIKKKLDDALLQEAVTRSIKTSADLDKKISTLAMNRRRRRILSSIVDKLLDEEKISEKRNDKLYDYMDDKEFDKVEKYIKKKFPEYLEESDSEDEKPKSKKKTGKGFDYDSSSDESSSSSESESENEKPKPRSRIIRKPLTKKKFSKKIEKEILDYLKQF